MADSVLMPLLLGVSLAWPDGRLSAGTVAFAHTGTGARVLIDTGAWHQRHALGAALDRLGLTPRDFDAVILTHLHWDHCMNFDMFEGVALGVSRAEWERVCSAHFDDATPRYLQSLFEAHGSISLLDTGDFLGLEILSTPGHTSGHIGVAMTCQDKRIVVAGDALPTRTAAFTGMPHAWHADASDAARSVAELLAAYDVVIPGHDAPFSTTNASLLLPGPNSRT